MTIIASVVKIDESKKGGTVELKIRNSKSGPQGTKNTMQDRKPRGRPKLLPIVKETTVPQAVIPPFIPPPDSPRFNENDQREDTDAENNTHSTSEPNEKPPTVPEAIPVTPEQPQPSSLPIQDKAVTQAPRYFTRGSAKRGANDLAEGERDAKRIRALIAKMLAGDNWDIEEVSDVMGSDFETALPAQVIAGIKIPRTYEEAITDPKYAKAWKAAMAEEMLSLIANETFKNTVAPEGANIVSYKWVFTVKTLVDGSIERFKARLVARGFSQVYGEDYNETFAPTVRMDTLRLFLATVAAEDLECSQFDIKNAFTESHLQEVIYLQPPKGAPIEKGKVWQVLRSLYGLKQAARDWNRLIKSELLKWGFIQSQADPCMFTHAENSVKLLVYVDDIVAAAKTQREIDWFYDKLCNRFNTKALGEIGKILGARVTRDRKNRTIYIDQEQYLLGVLEKFGITKETAKSKKVPAADYENLRPATDEDRRINVSEYQQAIGSIMYAMVFTRPDIAFVLGKLSQYMSDPAEHHGHALKHLFRYLRSTAK